MFCLRDNAPNAIQYAVAGRKAVWCELLQVLPLNKSTSYQVLPLNKVVSWNLFHLTHHLMVKRILLKKMCLPSLIMFQVSSFVDVVELVDTLS